MPYLKSLFFAALLAFSAVSHGQTSYRNISAAELSQLLEKEVIVVDIRRPEEWQQTGVVAGSHLLTLFDASGRPKPDFLPQLEALVPDKNTEIALICRTGARTRAASEALSQKLGYTQLLNVEKGIVDWIKGGHPVVQP